MFNIHVVTYKDYRMTFEHDADGQLWFFVRAPNQQVVSSAAIWPIGADGAEITKRWGTVDEFLSEKVIPDSNVALENYFGKGTAPAPTDVIGVLKLALQGVKFNPSTERLE